MLLRQLEYLAALAHEGHFGRAAQECGVSQPALSAGIRKLESELGVQIVSRGQRFDGLTTEGEEVLRWAQRVLADRRDLDHRIQVMGSHLTGTLRIGAIPTALSAASLLTGPLRADQPHLHFSLRSMNSRDIVAELDDLTLDVGMTYVDGEPLGHTRTVPLYRERYLLLTRDDGPLAALEEVTWRDAGAVPLCLLPAEMQNRRIVDGFLGEAGAHADVVVETDTISAIFAHVAALDLASIVPQTWLFGVALPDGLRVRPLPDPARGYHVGLVLSARRPETTLARALVEVASRIDVQRALEHEVVRRVPTAAALPGVPPRDG
ncbi:LysR family transcriptional regulator [Nocardioides zeae]|uniref:LysR family transcriptional regulator n=1 Tax=Nocardioides imazamoxiresistens TaxID=3231893 RepID=A0ABU3PWW1_9ACTN|nr:LysR family transcriptional regulator [Nocardioides zeae]MDT9593728.1 LysR family transcriptional regulator [Nocardioides zeae]